MLLPVVAGDIEQFLLSGQEVFHQFIVPEADHAQRRSEVTGIVIDEAFARTFDGGVISVF